MFSLRNVVVEAKSVDPDSRPARAARTSQLATVETISPRSAPPSATQASPSAAAAKRAAFKAKLAPSVDLDAEYSKRQHVIDFDPNNFSSL
jgi:hypothetical protein